MRAWRRAFRWHALLLDRQVGTGRILVFASTFDNVANDFRCTPPSCPSWNRTARYLAAGGRTGEPDGGARSLSSCATPNSAGAAAEVIGPRGERLLSLEQGTSRDNIQLTDAGILRDPQAQTDPTKPWR